VSASRQVALGLTCSAPGAGVFQEFGWFVIRSYPHQVEFQCVSQWLHMARRRTRGRRARRWARAQTRAACNSSNGKT